MGDLNHEQGTVELDQATQSFGAETFYNLTISTAGTKSATGAITVNNDLTTANTTGCKLDMQGNNLTLKGDLNVGAVNGLDLSDVSCELILSGSSAQGVTHAGATAGGTLTEGFQVLHCQLIGQDQVLLMYCLKMVDAPLVQLIIII